MFKQLRFVPIVKLNIVHQLLFLLCIEIFRKLFAHQKVHNVCIPAHRVFNFEYSLVKKVCIDFRLHLVNFNILKFGEVVGNIVFCSFSVHYLRVKLLK